MEVNGRWFLQIVDRGQHFPGVGVGCKKKFCGVSF